MRTAKTNLHLAIVIAWSLLVHLPGITAPLLDYHAHRQCQTASMARDYLRHGMHFFRPETDTAGPPTWTGTEFPLYSYLLAILYRLFGLHEPLGRVLSVLLTAWSAVFLYGLVRRRLGETVALWSALTMCAVPVHVYFTRTVQPESMALWGLIGFVYFLDRWLAGLIGPAAVAAAIGLGALGPLLKVSFLYLVAGLWLALGFEFVCLRRPGYWWILVAVIALTAAWYRYTRLAPAQILPLGAGSQWRNLRAVLKIGLWRAHFVSRFPEICATYSGLVLGILGARVLWRRGERLWFAWWIVTAVYIVLLGKYGWVHKYTEIPWAPINGVFIGAGLVATWRWAGDHQRRRVLVAVLALGIPLQAALRVHRWYRLERLWLFHAHDVLGRLSDRRELVLTNTNRVPVLLYFLDRAGYAIDLETASPRQMESALAKVRWFVTPVEGSWSRHPEWAAFVSARARLLYRDPAFWVYEVNAPVRATPRA